MKFHYALVQENYMKKNTLFIIINILCFHFLYAQDSSRAATLEETRALAKNIDSTKFLSESSEASCKCIDSILLTNRSNKEIVLDIKKCIDKEVIVYQMEFKLFQSLMNGDKKSSIVINDDTSSNEYKKYYYNIERRLTDSCKALRRAAASENKEDDHSMSKDPLALEQNEKGVDLIKKDDYAGALPYFKKAVEIDSMFAFAWDNIGICYRKANDLDNALRAYQRSLSIDPKGQMPLQNIAIVYEFKKEFDKEVDAYKKLLAIYPDDPEGYYGIGRVYTLFKNDMENGLDNFCKAYNLYVKLSSPFRADAEKNINAIYHQMKKDGKEDVFNKILKNNNITPEKN
jgi:tetratricopeptide (TPR) repeat protein